MESVGGITKRYSDNQITDTEFMEAIVAGNGETVQNYIYKSRPIDRLIPYFGAQLSPLVLACLMGQDAAVARLIKANADVNFQGLDGTSPLQAASQKGHHQVVDLLIKAQAEINLQANTGESALYIASKNGHHCVVDSLIKAQADVNLQRNTGESPLYIAVQNGHHQVVDSLIKAQADVNLQEVYGCSPLHIASQNNDHQVVDSLIKAQADVNLQEIDGCSPLYIASQNGHLQVVDSLIKAQANVNLQANNGAAPLHKASQNDHHQVVNSLIKAEADVNLQEINGCSPLCIASQNGHHHVVDTLIRAQADVNLQEIDGWSPLHIASQNGHHQVVDSLIKAEAEVNLQSNTGSSPLYIASQNGHHQVVDSLIKAQADVNLQKVNCCSPLFIASQNCHHQVVDSLIKAQADVNLQEINFCSPLYIASQYGHHQVVDSLIKAQADVNLQRNTGSSPVYIASQNGHLQVLDSLIKAQADVNIQTNNGSSPLYIASQNGYFRVVDLLIKAQANVRLQELHGCSPLYIASQNGHLHVVDSLIKAHADVNLQRNTGSSPLYIASQNGHLNVVDLLIKAPANVNLQEIDGCSSLYIASQNGHLPVVVSLIKAQADVNLQTNTGESPLYIASGNNNHQVVDSLIKAQADVNLQANTGESPLYIASKNGHHQVVESLIKAGSDVNLQAKTGESPLNIASKNGCHQVVDSLTKVQANSCLLRSNEMLSIAQMEPKAASRPVPSDSELSLQLHSALTQSGFVESRAVIQSAAADCLQTILRKRRHGDDAIFVVGSFSEGWGNSLVTLDGRTDSESDIDVMHLIPGRLYHLRGLCRCQEMQTQQMEYLDGHIMCSGFASNPANPAFGSTLRPAVDDVSACRLCCYPPIAPLLPDREAKSNIPKSVLKSLKLDLDASTSPCHVVHAAAPGQAGKQLRVSTTFLEKRLLRSLSTLQGQLFVTLKYLLKKVICHRVSGLRSYHVKTITFRMLEETPAEQWQPENLVSLTRRSLKMLLDSMLMQLESSCRSGRADYRIMDHYFLCDTALYLKGIDHRDEQKTMANLKNIVRVLKEVIDELPHLLMNHIDSLRPVSESGRFYFHPFLILPELQVVTAPVSKSSSLEYHEIYDVVRESLLHLSQGDCGLRSQSSLTEMIGRLPDCARSAREALRALACLKFGNRDAAVAVLSDCRGHEVSRGIAWSAGRSRAEATVDFVWQHLRTCDSAWKFCFRFDQRPTLKFLSPYMMECFPLEVEKYNSYFYVNFDALVQCLRLELIVVDASARDWIWGVTQREDADVQELLVAALNCGDEEMATRLLGRALSVSRSASFIGRIISASL